MATQSNIGKYLEISQSPNCKAAHTERTNKLNLDEYFLYFTTWLVINFMKLNILFVSKNYNKFFKQPYFSKHEKKLVKYNF